MLGREEDEITWSKYFGEDGKEMKGLQMTYIMSYEEFCNIMAMGEDRFPKDGLMILCEKHTHFLQILKAPTEEWDFTDISLSTLSFPREIHFSSHDEEGNLINKFVGNMWKNIRLNGTYHLEFRPMEGVVPDSFWSENKTWVTNSQICLPSP